MVKSRLTVEPMAFDTTIGVQYTTSERMAGTISNVFKDIFADWEGCSIDYNTTTGTMDINVYLSDKGDVEGKIRSIQPIGIKSSKNEDLNKLFKAAGQKAVNNKGGHVFALTEEAKDIFSELLPTPPHIKIDWNKVYHERTADSGLRFNYNVYSVVVGLKLDKFLEKMYGTHDKDGARLFYQTAMVTHLSGNPTGQNNVGANGLHHGNFIMTISRLRETEIAKISQLTHKGGTNLPFVF